MILHLLTDDKFADYAIRQFSGSEMNSEFVLVPSNNMMKYVKLSDQCRIVKQFSPEYEALINSLEQYTGVIFHGLFWGRWQNNVLKRMPEKVKVAWVFWGGEIYSRHEYNDLYYAPLTKMLCSFHTHWTGKKMDLSDEIPMELYKRIDYCLTDMEEEYRIAKQCTGASFKYLWYNYYSIEQTIGALADRYCSGTNIWIGNSAAESNNHLDVFWKLWKYGFLRRDEHKVIIPLSYGAAWCRNVVQKVAKFLYGERVQCLTDFLPRDQYNELMLSCSTIILGYYEPAAQGNIITALWLGMRVYLSEKSATYDFFQRIGCIIFSIEKDLKRSNSNAFAPLSEDEINRNREILKNWYSVEVMHKKNIEIVKALS